MIETNMHDAKTRLSQLVEAAERGEQVVLKRNGFPVARLEAIRRSTFPFGFLSEQAGDISDSLLFDSSEELDDFTRL